MPCVAVRRHAASGLFLVPPVGANVWVEFEAGDPDYPIWAGCFWGTGEVPALARRCRPTKMLKTDGLTLKIDDLPGAGGVDDRGQAAGRATPLKIIFDAAASSCSNGARQIKLTPATRVGQRRRAGGDLMPGQLCTSAPTCCVRTAARPADRLVNPRVLVGGSRPWHTLRRLVHGRGRARSSAARPGQAAAVRRRVAVARARRARDDRRQAGAPPGRAAAMCQSADRSRRAPPNVLVTQVRARGRT